MAWKTGTIKLDAAREIFSGVVLEEIKIGELTVGYKATWNGIVLEDRSLTKLCRHLWESRHAT